MTDVLVTGLPRAGTALVSALIDYLPDAISFNTPQWQVDQARNRFLDAEDYSKWLVGDYAWMRKNLLSQKEVGDIRAPDGSALLDGLYDPRQKFIDMPAEGGGTTQEPEIYNFIRPGLSPDFILSMRHHTLYTSLLPMLAQFNHFKVIAVIRHPMDVLNSWRALPQPLIARGRPHGIARYWPEALAICESKLEVADQLVQLYDAYIQRYHELRNFIHIVKFEDIIDDPSIVSQLVGVKERSPGARFIEPQSSMRITAEVKIFRERFRKYGVFTKLYYPDI